MSALEAIFSQVHSKDLELEEARMRAEREQRRLLRLQATVGQGMNITELLAKVAGVEAPAPDELPSLSPRETSNAAVKPGFPPPPTSAQPKPSP